MLFSQEIHEIADKNRLYVLEDFLTTPVKIYYGNYSTYEIGDIFEDIHYKRPSKKVKGIIVDKSRKRNEEFLPFSVS